MSRPPVHAGHARPISAPGRPLASQPAKPDMHWALSGVYAIDREGMTDGRLQRHADISLPGPRASGRRQSPGFNIQDHMQKKLEEQSKATPFAAPANAAVRNICVYCGSNPGNNPAYVRAAQVFGRRMAEADIGLVYGGGGRGLMGEVARAVLAHGGRVTGIIPAFLSEKEQMLREVDELVVVDDMHQRKKLMFDRSDAFVALPGGIGTLEELVEQLTWAQLGRHMKPIAVANIEGCWDPFLALIRHMQSEGFIRREMDVNFLAIDRAEDILPAILAAARPTPPEAAARVAEKF